MSSKTKQKAKHCSEQGRSLDRQITTQDLDCLREAFSLFDVDRTEAITTEELGKVAEIKGNSLYYWTSLLSL